MQNITDHDIENVSFQVSPNIMPFGRSLDFSTLISHLLHPSHPKLSKHGLSLLYTLAITTVFMNSEDAGIMMQPGMH